MNLKPMKGGKACSVIGFVFSVNNINLVVTEARVSLVLLKMEY
jgi:hypothetical protein